MAEGELGALFEGLAKDADEAAGKIAERLAGHTEKTAELAEKNLTAALEAEEQTTKAVSEVGKKSGDVEGNATPKTPGVTGPPWPTTEGVPGSARGKSLNPPNARHTVAGAKHGQVKGENSIILRGNEQAVRDDVSRIAAGDAKWNPATQRYEINGRSYGVEPSGTVFPDSGAGIVKLDRNEYAALKEIAKADGDPSKVPAFSRDPRFVNNPQVIAKAKAIYDGTYSP